MLRNGVREYILKPVERERITEILVKLNAELENERNKQNTLQKLGYQQMKHLMLFDDITEEELQTLENQYEKDFFEGNYVVFCRMAKSGTDSRTEDIICLHQLKENDCYIVRGEAAASLLEEVSVEGCVGVSAPHSGLRELREAYMESLNMQHRAFCRNMPVVYFDRNTEHVPEKLVEEAKKLLTDAAKLSRVHLIGTDRREELERVWHQFFFEVKNGRISESQYESCMEDFASSVEETYRVVLEECTDEENWNYRNYFGEKNINAYEEKFMDWILLLHEAVNSRLYVNRNRQKIEQAVEYIEQNYEKDLNMAVVSNYISMNYSLFSYSFKQYTGSNFVNYLKDIRMREAKRLLRETDMRIIEISQAVGYDNEKYFMKLFKSACGVSPSEYRNNMRGN